MEGTNQPAGVRYASTDEMRSEFGDYRVNKELPTLNDASVPDPIADDMVTNDPYCIQADDYSTNEN